MEILLLVERHDSQWEQNVANRHRGVHQGNQSRREDIAQSADKSRIANCVEINWALFVVIRDYRFHFVEIPLAGDL